MKISRKVKTRITKLFKGGKTIEDIMGAIREDSPRTTSTTINQIIRKHLTDLADELWSTAVKLGGRCAISNRTTNLEAHHLIKRGNHAYRWDLNNGICLYCRTHGDAESDEAAFFLWLSKNKKAQWKWYQEHKDLEKCGRWVDNHALLEICKELNTYINKNRRK